MSTDTEIRELFQRNKVQLAKDDVWTVQSSYVVKHKALERLAAALGIQYEPPKILRAERDEAVILVTGKLSDHVEWSIGEALVNANYRVTGKMAPYVFAMAEKRAKDRVILKLAGLHGVYSEDEADEFSDRAPRQPQTTTTAHVSEVNTSGPLTQEGSTEARDVLLKTIEMAKTGADLDKWKAENDATINRLMRADFEIIKAAYLGAKTKFKPKAVA
jgi:hypothetical protein